MPDFRDEPTARDEIAFLLLSILLDLPARERGMPHCETEPSRPVFALLYWRAGLPPERFLTTGVRRELRCYTPDRLGASFQSRINAQCLVPRALMGQQ